ncbi:MAG: hypothetical protein WCQ21_37360, partial [Verrucomicrobiota bacterium]
PKPEGRKKAEFRNPKTETQGRARFGLRVSAFFRPSTFGLRTSSRASAAPPYELAGRAPLLI